MELGISDYQKIKSAYLCFVYFALVPRLLVFPGIFGQRYLRTAAALCALYAVNYFILENYFIAERAPTLYEAFYGPVISVWMALMNCKIQKDNPDYYKGEFRRRW